MGTLAILEDNLLEYEVIYEGDSVPGWRNASVDFPGTYRFFVIEGQRGGFVMDQDQGDLSIDNLLLDIGNCKGKSYGLYEY